MFWCSQNGKNWHFWSFWTIRNLAPEFLSSAYKLFPTLNFDKMTKIGTFGAFCTIQNLENFVLEFKQI